MKRILIVCLLGMGLLLPSTTITAKEFSNTKPAKHTIDVWVEFETTIATSDATSGTLTLVKIFDSQKHKVIEQSLSGYYDDVDVSTLSPGYYMVQVFTTLSGYSEVVYVN